MALHQGLHKRGHSSLEHRVRRIHRTDWGGAFVGAKIAFLMLLDEGLSGVSRCGKGCFCECNR